MFIVKLYIHTKVSYPYYITKTGVKKILELEACILYLTETANIEAQKGICIYLDVLEI